MAFGKRLDLCVTSGFSMALYGPAGAWKTSLCRTLPSDQTLYLGIEGGEEVLKGHCNPLFERPAKPSKRQPNAFKGDLDRVYNSLMVEKHNIHFVVIDSATEMEKYFQLGLCYAAGKDITSLKEYGGGSDLSYKSIVEFRDLKFPENSNCGHAINTIFIAGEFPIPIQRDADSQISMIYPMLTSKLSVKLSHLLDLIIRVEVSADGTRFLRVRPTDKLCAKSRYPSMSENISGVDTSFNFFERVIKPVQSDISRSNVSDSHTPQPSPSGRQPGPAKL